MVSEVPLGHCSKQLKIKFYSLFCKFLTDKLKTIFLGKARQCVQNSLSPKLVKATILGNRFKAT